MTYLSINKLLCPDQFGFRPQNQTTHVVHKMMNYISEKSIDNEVTIATFIDLSKAFDCLQYDKLFKKLESLGITGIELQWFKDYLSNRKQCVDLDGVQSEWIDVQLGVPQGSILGPILFLIYVNDINNCTDIASFTKFADDTTLLTSGKTLQEAADKMNTALSQVDTWFQKNKLNLNPSKTRYMIFNSKSEETDIVKIGDEYITRVHDKGKETCFKLVGIQIDEKLKWTEHINYICKKINYALYGLTKSSKELDERNKKLLYSGLIHSHLTFGLPMWGCAKKGRLNILLLKQKKAIRKIYNLKYRDHTHEYFIKGKILKLPELIKHSIMCYMQSGVWTYSPEHIKNLWQIRTSEVNYLRDTTLKMTYTVTSKQWINDLPPITHAKLWNNYTQPKHDEPKDFKRYSKYDLLKEYETLEHTN